MRIYGAGMAGLLAANMLRHYQPTVHEAKPDLPDNHGALLRFRTQSVSRVTGINFKRVMVEKAVKMDGRVTYEPSLRASNMYSFKVTGAIIPRSIINLEPGCRYIAPDDFISVMARQAKIEYGSSLDEGFLYDSSENIAISTIPMPSLMKIVSWQDEPEFKFLPIWSLRAKIESPDTEVYQTIYYPEYETQFYRASITGNQLIIEYNREPKSNTYTSDIRKVLRDFGIERPRTEGVEVKYQHYGKLLPIDEDARRSFILAMTEKYGIYSVGRFATWRQLLLDDIVRDIGIVERFILDRNNYARHMHYHG